MIGLGLFWGEHSQKKICQTDSSGSTLPPRESITPWGHRIHLFQSGPERAQPAQVHLDLILGVRLALATTHGWKILKLVSWHEVKH